MKLKLVTSALLIGGLLLPVGGYAAYDNDQGRDSAKHFVKDAAITTKVKAKLAKAKGVSARHIKVETNADGVVQLSGKARSQEEADKAVQLASSVKGVSSVENNIEIASHR